MKKTVLVTGGAGFLGINLIRYLLKKKYRIISLDIADFEYPEKNKIEAIKGDIRDKKLIDTIMSRVDIVVHCAAALPLYSPQDIYSTDVGGVKTLLESALKNQINRFIHISSTAVYGIPDHHPLYETDKLCGVGPYGESKVKAEALCRHYRKKGLIIPILRPKSFVGPERLGVFALLYDWASSGHGFPILGDGKNIYQLLDVEDLCAVIHQTLTLPKKTVNDTFNIGASKYKTMAEDFQAVLDVAGFGKKIKPLPLRPAVWTLRFLEKLHLSPLYKWVYETAGQDSYVSIEKAQKILKFIPKYSNQQALIRNYQWYLSHKDHFIGQSGITHRVPWKQGVLGLAKKLL